ncbi:DUF1593 domain-containing protein [Aestuariibacter sp. GS-14]|uniref:DUF1593 domain-containing protein n=1 Tax=Aestuariibacter sp. GS-14 TaxID=2590670 RepID=UPI0011273491|nr:DUF1593 domain-containing protein [Aestuariibacter sp. GS-14]TPV53687.1 DUF1593 domain-containing protein [Aestuariibacter sp. GS-14]
MKLICVSAIKSVLIVIVSAIFCTYAFGEQQPEIKNRVFVLTDIEADPDDAQTLVRFLLYSNQFDVEGLVATTSVHQKGMVAPETIHQIIDAYAKVHNNLLLHEPGYPTAEYLRSVVRAGLPIYGMNGVGKNKDSEGSRLLINAIEKDDSRPLWISVWGGANTLAQALYTLQQQTSPQQLAQLISKLRVYTISDQDDSAAWIRKTFPDLFYIVSPGGYGAATWLGMNMYIEGIDNTSVSNPWIANNIQQNHGPLGQQYPDVAYGMEGDTPAWLNLIRNGLNVPEQPNFGGWGGRYEYYIPDINATDPDGFTGGVPIEQETRPIWTNATDTFLLPRRNEFGRSVSASEQHFSGYRETLWRWRDDFQNDFAARMDWTVFDYAHANHPPEPRLRHEQHLKVKSGDYFSLDARNSQDPDGDSMEFYWFNYAEAGSMPASPVAIQSAENMARVAVVAPEVSKPETLHFILRLTDRGTPALTRYKRVVVTVVPK